MTQANDGKEEKGALRVDQNQLINEKGFSFSGYERDPLYLNLGNKKFKDISGVSGIDSITDGRAGVFADFDNDGDLDVFMTTIQGQAHLLFRNNVGQSNNFLRIALEGDKSVGRDAYGAVIRIRTSAGTLTKINNGGAGFISQHDQRLLFGVGRDERATHIEVTWPNGQVERFAGEAKAGASLLLRKGSGRAVSLTVGRVNLPDPLTRAESFARGLKIAIGKPLPNLQMKTLGGAATSLQQQLRPGRRLLINIWATWCMPCAREMPELEKLRPRFAAHGVDLIGMNVDTEANADIKGYMKERGVQYPTYIGGVPVIEQLYATDEMAVPLSILVDEKGIVTHLIPGWSDETQKKFAALAGGESIKGAKPQPARRARRP